MGGVFPYSDCKMGDCITFSVSKENKTKTFNAVVYTRINNIFNATVLVVGFRPYKSKYSLLLQEREGKIFILDSDGREIPKFVTTISLSRIVMFEKALLSFDMPETPKSISEFIYLQGALHFGVKSPYLEHNELAKLYF